MHPRTSRLLTGLVSLGTIALLSACSAKSGGGGTAAPGTDGAISSAAVSAAPAGSILAKLISYTNAESAGPTGDYYWKNGPAKIVKSAMPAPGSVKFGPDSQGRSGVARASLTYSMFVASQGSRQGEPIDPPSWPSNNPKVAISSSLTGKIYHGYFYNRSHSVADSLAGKLSYTSEYNFTSSSRTQNVGADQNGGMRAAEEIAEGYWKNHTGSKTVIYYQTTPVYSGSERDPRGSIVDELSSDGAVNDEIVVLNDAEGWAMNYNTSAIAQGKVVPAGTSAPTSTTSSSASTSSGSAIAPAKNGLDPRFATCSAANAAGYGPYLKGKDAEYPWYRDANSDGKVC